MHKNITFKKQGNGQDSWVITYPNNPEMMPEIVYEDPNKLKKIDISKIDLNNPTDADILLLKRLATELKKYM